MNQTDLETELEGLWDIIMSGIDFNKNLEIFIRRFVELKIEEDRTKIEKLDKKR